MIWQNIFLSYISLFALGLADNIRGPLYPEIVNTFSLSNSVGSMMFAVSSLMSLFGGLHSPLLMQRWSLYKLLAFGLFCLTAGLAIITISPNFWCLLLGSCLLGYSFGPLGISQNSLLVQGTNPMNRLLWMGGLHSLYGLASFAAPVIVAGIADFSTPWRWGFGITSVSVLAISLVAAFLKVPHNNISFSSSREGYSFTKHEFHLTVVFAFYVIAELLVGTRLAQYMRIEMDYDLRASSLSVTAFYLLMLLGRVVFIFARLPWRLKNIMLGSLVLTLVNMILGMWVHPFFWILTGLTMAPFYAWAMTFVAEVFHQSAERAIALIISTDALLLVVMHLSVGQVTDRWGIWIAMAMAPIFIIISLIALFTFPARLEPPKVGTRGP